MSILSRLFGLGGFMLALWAIIGRFKGPPTIAFYGEEFAASSVLQTANTFLLLALIFAILTRRR